MKSLEDFFKEDRYQTSDALGRDAYKAYLRIELSAMAMQGMLSNATIIKAVNSMKLQSDEIISTLSIEYADHLIKQLKL